MDIIWFLQINYVTMWWPCSHHDMISVKVTLIHLTPPRLSKENSHCPPGKCSHCQQWPLVPGKRHTSLLTSPHSNQLVVFGGEVSIRSQYSLGYFICSHFQKAKTMSGLKAENIILIFFSFNLPLSGTKITHRNYSENIDRIENNLTLPHWQQKDGW